MDFRGQPEISREYGLSGTEPVINQECMLVHERVDICQFEWYRDNIEYITVSNRKVWGVFLYPGQPLMEKILS